MNDTGSMGETEIGMLQVWVVITSLCRMYPKIMRVIKTKVTISFSTCSDAI